MRRASSRAASRHCSPASRQASMACRAAVSATRTSSMAEAASDFCESFLRDMTRFTPSFGLADLTSQYGPRIVGVYTGLPQCSVPDGPARAGITWAGLECGRACRASLQMDLPATVQDLQVHVFQHVSVFGTESAPVSATSCDLLKR